MQYKRITLFAGHYGSGKTNIAVNFAIHLKKQGFPVTIADLDIVNPYFRTKDSSSELKALGIDIISSEFANSNLDLPALPKEIYAITSDKSVYAVMDIGGDDRGATALGRYTPDILKENNYEMVFVANCYRPLTRNAKDAIEVMREIESVSGIPFTSIINNSNIGNETKPEDVIESLPFIEELAKISHLPVYMTTATQKVCQGLYGKIENLFPINLQKKYFDIEERQDNGEIDI
jgi:hypothetical protein